jgi:hypothetical protein
MTFYAPRNITPADQILFDADGNAVGIQPAASSSPPVLGFNPTKHAAIDSLVSAPWNRIGSTRPQSAQTNRNLIAALDLGHVASGWSYTDLTGGTFTASGGAGAYAAQASAYGNVPALLTVNAGSTGNTSRVAWSAGFEGDFMDRGAVFSMIIEVLSGMNSNNTVRLIFSSDGGATKTMTGTLTINKDRGPLHFVNFYPDTNDFVGAGSESFTNTMNYMAVEVTSAGGTTGGQIAVHGIWRGQRRIPTCTIQFDDGWLTQYTSAFQYMASRGLVGDIGVARNYINGPNYMNLAQFNEMYAAGWDMVVHGELNHNNAAFTTSALLRADIADNQAWLLENGWTRGAYEYIYPGGIINWSLDSKAQLRSLNFRTARLVTSGYTSPNAWGLGDPLALNGRDLSGSYTAASDLLLLDRIIGNCSHVTFYGHKLVRAAPAASEMTFAEFKTLIDGISDRVRDGKVAIITQAKLADLYVR